MLLRVGLVKWAALIMAAGVPTASKRKAQWVCCNESYFMGLIWKRVICFSIIHQDPEQLVAGWVLCVFYASFSSWRPHVSLGLVALVARWLPGAQPGLRRAQGERSSAYTGSFRNQINTSPATHCITVQGTCVHFWNNPRKMDDYGNLGSLIISSRKVG